MIRLSVYVLAICTTLFGVPAKAATPNACALVFKETSLIIASGVRESGELVVAPSSWKVTHGELLQSVKLGPASDRYASTQESLAIKLPEGARSGVITAHAKFTDRVYESMGRLFGTIKSEVEINRKYASISFVADHQNRDLKLKLVLRVLDHAGKEHTYFQKIPHTQGNDWVALPITKFLALDKDNSPSIEQLLETGTHRQVANDNFLASISIVATRARDSNSDLSARIEGGFSFGTSIPKSFDPGKDLALADYEHPDLGPIKYISDYKNDYIPKDELRSALSKFFANMRKPENFQKSKEATINGERFLRNELEQYGWTLGRTLSEKVTMRDLMGVIGRGQIPIEEGSFGQLHGRFAHQRQILAGMYGLDAHEVQIVNAFIRHYIVFNFGNWGIWNMLFDSRGDTIFSNRYWRE